MDLKEIGCRIKTIRKSNRLTQEQLAELINVSPHYIYEIEKGLKKMSLDTLTSLSSSLNVSADYILFGYSPEPSGQEYKYFDQLDQLLQLLTHTQRKSITKIIQTILPLLK